MSAASPGAQGDDPVEGLLRRVRRWLDSEAPDPASHPDATAFAAYVDWLAGGAIGECPEPETQAHAAACRECYRKAEGLVLAHNEAEREMLCSAPARFDLYLAHEPAEAYVVFTDEGGCRARRPLALEPRFGAFPLAGAVAEASPSFGSAPSAGEGGPPPMPAGLACVAVEAHAARGRFDLTVTAHRRATGEPLPGIIVRFFTASGETLREDTTDAQGRACFYSLDPREYRIEIFA